MARRPVAVSKKAVTSAADPLKLKGETALSEEVKTQHKIWKGHDFRCETDAVGHAQPKGRSPEQLVLDATEGFIPLWDKGSILRWRFRDTSLEFFGNPKAARTELTKLFAEAVLAWGDSVPVKFAYREDAWDFEIVMRQADEGNVLASAFFPDAGRHQLHIYPLLLQQERKEQVETLAHEMGHIFGLRHFFARVSERAWPAELFGRQSRFTIMNYGAESTLTKEDRSDLTTLYAAAWSGRLTHINGTPIKLVRPYHTLGEITSGAFAIAAAST